ncbi:MAG: type II toxin-antitoxin system RelE/ParE family toxin [Verrucomicrobiota bacterium]
MADYATGVYYHVHLQFIESPIYSEQIDDLLSKEEHQRLQLHLLERPHRGDFIKGTGGLRKLRWAGSGRGKRGGIRVIYFLWREDTAFMLFAYSKNKQDDLTPAQARVLRDLIKRFTNE